VPTQPACLQESPIGLKGRRNGRSKRCGGRRNTALHRFEKDLRGFAEDIYPERTGKIYFKRLALSREQIDRWHLPTRPTKEYGPYFDDDESAELDAIASISLSVARPL
jgi:hypothetical protein